MDLSHRFDDFDDFDDSEESFDIDIWWTVATLSVMFGSVWVFQTIGAWLELSRNVLNVGTYALLCGGFWLCQRGRAGSESEASLD